MTEDYDDIVEVAKGVKDALPGDKGDWKIATGNGPDRIIIVNSDEAAEEYAREIHEAKGGL